MVTGDYTHAGFKVVVTVENGVTVYNAVSSEGFGATLTIPAETPLRKRVSMVSRFNRILDGLD